MATAAAARQQRSKPLPANHTNEPLPVLKRDYMQIPNSIQPLCQRLDGTGKQIVLEICFHTWGGFMPGRTRDENRNFERPKWWYTTRAAIAHLCGVTPGAIDKQFALMKNRERPEDGIIEVEQLGKPIKGRPTNNGEEEANLSLRICLHPEHYTMLPEKEPGRKQMGIADTPDSAAPMVPDDHRPFVRASLPPTTVPPRTRSEWQSLGDVPICYHNQRPHPVTIVGRSVARGIVIEIPKEQPNAFSDLGPPNTEQITARSNLPPQHVRQPFAHRNTLPAAALFDTLCEVFDRCGKPLSVALSERCKRKFLNYPPQVQERIVLDACAREQHTWDKPAFTPSMLEYLERKNPKHDWDLHPIKARTAPGGKPGRVVEREQSNARALDWAREQDRKAGRRRE